MDDYLSPQIIENKKDLDIRHWTFMSWLEKTQQCGGVKPVNRIPTIISINRIPTTMPIGSLVAI